MIPMISTVCHDNPSGMTSAHTDKNRLMIDVCVCEVSLDYTQPFSTFNDTSFRSGSKVGTENP